MKNYIERYNWILDQYNGGLITPLEALYKLQEVYKHKIRLLLQVEKLLKDLQDEKIIDDNYLAFTILSLTRSLDE